MAVRAFRGKTPVIDPSAYVDPMAVVIGDVVIGADSSIWPMASVRGDVNYIRIGARTSIQDGTVIHVTSPHPAEPEGVPTIVGDGITVGHRCMLHACTIESHCLVGMGSTILDRAVLREGVLLGAGSLVTEGKELEGGYLWLGRPARRIRPLTEEEKAALRHSAEHYARLKDYYRGGA
jgi:carbonic anhydrase/acetyltransferase-like protein (isoleucine patch superfamily)